MSPAEFATARRCELTELLVDQCAHCRHERGADDETAEFRRALLADGWTAARWPGSCARCGEAFDAGTAIRTDDADNGWRSECCAPGWAPAADTSHACPGGCGARVARHRFACRDCWFALPSGLRCAISSNNPEAHLEAMVAARRYYDDNRRDSRR